MSNDSQVGAMFRRAEFVAVAGRACRFNGAPDIQPFRRLLETDGNAVTDGATPSGPNRLWELFKDPLHLRR